MRMLALAALLVSTGAHAEQARLSVTLPPASAVATSEFRCEEVASASLSAEVGDPPSLDGTVRQGTQVFFMRVTGDSLNLLAEAEVALGETGHPLSVFQDDESQLVAMGPDMGGIMLFLLQRETGFAVWSRTRPVSWLGYAAPDVQAVYFTCK